MGKYPADETNLTKIPKCVPPEGSGYRPRGPQACGSVTPVHILPEQIGHTPIKDGATHQAQTGKNKRNIKQMSLQERGMMAIITPVQMMQGGPACQSPLNQE
eukprot:5846463-Karenia_brevis.AAC.1